MTDESILKLLKSSLIDDSRLGAVLLVQKYPTKELLINFMETHGVEDMSASTQEDMDLITNYKLTTKLSDGWLLLETEIDVLIALGTNIWLYRMEDSTWDYKNSHNKIDKL